MKDVYIANSYIPEGIVIDENNFLKYVAKIPVPLGTWKELGLLESSVENQKKLILFTRFQIKKLQEKGIKFPITFL